MSTQQQSGDSLSAWRKPRDWLSVSAWSPRISYQYSYRVEPSILSDFTYLGNNISDDGEVTIEVSTRISKASRTFGFLQQSIFRNQHLLIATKREVYKARSSRSCSMGQRRGPSKSIVCPASTSQSASAFPCCCGQIFLAKRRPHTS